MTHYNPAHSHSEKRKGNPERIGRPPSIRVSCFPLRPLQIRRFEQNVEKFLAGEWELASFVLAPEGQISSKAAVELGCNQLDAVWRMTSVELEIIEQSQRNLPTLDSQSDHRFHAVQRPSPAPWAVHKTVPTISHIGNLSRSRLELAPRLLEQTEKNSRTAAGPEVNKNKKSPTFPPTRTFYIC